jgi:hypothetical protein
MTTYRTYCIGTVFKHCGGVYKRAALQVQIHVTCQGHQFVAVLRRYLDKGFVATRQSRTLVSSCLNLCRVVLLPCRLLSWWERCRCCPWRSSAPSLEHPGQTLFWVSNYKNDSGKIHFASNDKHTGLVFPIGTVVRGYHRNIRAQIKNTEQCNCIQINFSSKVKM